MNFLAGKINWFDRHYKRVINTHFFLSLFTAHINKTEKNLHTIDHIGKKNCSMHFFAPDFDETMFEVQSLCLMCIQISCFNWFTLSSKRNVWVLAALRHAIISTINTINIIKYTYWNSVRNEQEIIVYCTRLTIYLTFHE